MNFIEIQGSTINAESIDCVSPIEREDGYPSYSITLRSGVVITVSSMDHIAANNSRDALLKRLTHFRVDTL